MSARAPNYRFFREPVAATPQLGIATMCGALFGGSRTVWRQRAQGYGTRHSSEGRGKQQCVLQGNHFEHKRPCGVEGQSRAMHIAGQASGTLRRVGSEPRGDFAVQLAVKMKSSEFSLATSAQQRLQRSPQQRLPSGILRQDYNYGVVNADW